MADATGPQKWTARRSAVDSNSPLHEPHGRSIGRPHSLGHSVERAALAPLLPGSQITPDYQGAKSRLEEFLENDLPAALGLEGFTDDLFAPGAEDRAHWIKTFYLLFRRPAFTADPSFHRIALDEGRNWETAVASDLSVVVFDQIFPELVRALAAYDKKRPETLLGSIWTKFAKQPSLSSTDYCSFSTWKTAISYRPEMTVTTTTDFASLSASP